MATAQELTTNEPKTSHVFSLSKAEIRRRNQAAGALLDAWERDGDEDEQRETMAVLRRALGENREMSDRPIFS
jgi:hypothetical protein